jgi:hypothetical protein
MVAAAQEWSSWCRITKGFSRLGLADAAARPGLSPAGEGLDDDDVPTAAWTRRINIERLFRQLVIGRRCDGEQFAGTREAGFARGSGEQAVVTDAMEPAREQVEQEAADELGGGKCHEAHTQDYYSAGQCVSASPTDPLRPPIVNVDPRECPENGGSSGVAVPLVLVGSG